VGPLHLVVAAQMFFWCLVFGAIVRAFDTLWALAVASVVAIILNAVVSPLMLGLSSRLFGPCWYR